MACPIGTCPMCLTPGVELLDSHVLQRAGYRPLHVPAHLAQPGQNRNPVVIHKGEWSQKSGQVHEHMLCRPCEDRLARGDKYVSTIMCKGSMFPATGMVGHLYGEDARGRYVEPGQLDAGLLAYYAAGIVWRGHEAKSVPECNLGPYADAFRKYLLGERKFPANSTARAYLVRDDMPKWQTASSFMLTPVSKPDTRQKNRPRRDVHLFAINGLYFAVHTGIGFDEMENGLASSSPVIALVSPQEFISWVAELVPDVPRNWATL